MIDKVVIPVAGLGTRLQPATKSQPKEMLPVGRKPTVQYVVEELVRQGLRNILFVTGWKKRAIEDHFDENPDLLEKLTGKKESKVIDSTVPVNFFYARQGQPRGLGDAVRYGESFVRGEPFVVALGDAIIRYRNHSDLIGRLIRSHLDYKSSCTIAVTEVPEEEIGLYGIVKPKKDGTETDSNFAVEDVLEKPSVGDAPSTYAISARYVFSPDIFGAIRRTPPGPNGEIGLSHAIRTLLKMGGSVRCVVLNENEKRYDIGSYETYFRAFIDFASEDEVCGPAIQHYMWNRLRELHFDPEQHPNRKAKA